MLFRTLSAAVLFTLAGTAQSTWPQLRLIVVANGLSSPVDIQTARDGSGRMFVVEQAGVIRIIKNGALSPGAFLDIRSKVACCGETGLLGLAFPPDFTAKHYFYVNYTERAPNLRTVIARYRVRGINPDAADPGSEERILVIDQPFDNHNGGQIAFGPKDGMLYIGTGDGGSGGDPLNNGQTGSALLGKMLRIDTESGTSPYAIPADNPFLNRAGFRPEIWAYGLRNPWRFSFDRSTGDLWIGDVGQNRVEELDFRPASTTGGENYGWNITEGSRCYNPSSGCSLSGLTLPIFEYSHDLGSSIIGGYVYRGSLLPSWQGIHFAADLSSGRIWGVRSGGTSQQLTTLSGPPSISTFGQDDAGELYMARIDNGTVYKLVDATPSVQPAGVVNAASYQQGIVPGSLITVFGAGVSGDPGIQQPPSTPLPSSWNGSAVYVNDIAAPVYAVANVGGQEQINVQVPWEVASQTRVNLTAARGSVRSSAAGLDVLAAQPGIFTSDGSRGVIAFNDSGRLVTPQEPAGTGQTLVIYATGLGAVDNTPPTGAATPASPLARVKDTVRVTVAGAEAEVLFAGLAPGFVGLYQVNVRLPQGVPAGDQEVVLQAGTAKSPAVKLAVR